MKIIKLLFSEILMGILLIIFAVAIGYATFIENDFDAIAARAAVYNARWFELLMLLMVINFSGMIFTRKLYRKDKLNILLIHLSLIVILIGAALTRYLGFEGIMHIRNGETSNSFVSSDTYLTLTGSDETQREPVMLSSKKEDFFSKTITVNDELVDCRIESFYENAVPKVVRAAAGVTSANTVLKLTLQGPAHVHPVLIKNGETKNTHELGISYADTSAQRNVHIIEGVDGLMIRLPLNYKTTNTVQGKPSHSKFISLRQGAKYRFSDMTLILEEKIEQAIIQYSPAEEHDPPGTKIVNMRINDVPLTLPFNATKKVKIGDESIAVSVGTLETELPFTLHLTEFELERYPGSNSPSSFASEIVLIDEEENLILPYRIFMNNILSYKGYRFYQSSYDQDERGTVLSVNSDYWGTNVTYIGYFLLFASLIVSFFTKKTRFARLLRQFENVRESRKSMVTTLVFLLLWMVSVQTPVFGQGDNDLPLVNKEHAAAFGRLQVQSQQGRIMPINTLASQVLIKIYKKDRYEKISADQVFLEMVTNPTQWMKKPIIVIGNRELKELLDISEEHARYIDFFTEEGVYKISQQVNDAYKQKPALRTKFDKEVIYIDERVNVLTMTFEGEVLRIFPLVHSSNNTWGTAAQFEESATMLGLDSLFKLYNENLISARLTGDYNSADLTLKAISDFQHSAGKDIILTETEVFFEILYNETNIFKRLFPFYLMMGIFLTGIFFLQVFKPKLHLGILNNVMIGVLLIAFSFQTFGLALRWYVSEHAPWSNGYESMLYISWVTILAGLLFVKKSQMTLAVAVLLAGITLLTAHMSWLNPEITNLVPVLKSYWLTIHVATITASYGFLGMAAMLGFMNLCIMIFRTQLNKLRVDLTITELTIIIELALMVGLVLLIIGNFLGGIWANESWGRYWGWDPKETWTLVTIIVYSFILHLKMIRGMRTHFSFNFGSLIGFSTVLMTYFGVNYYLSGLHSYAQGDPVAVPTFVYVILGVIAIVSTLAGFNSYRIKSSQPEIAEH